VGPAAAAFAEYGVNIAYYFIRATMATGRFSICSVVVHTRIHKTLILDRCFTGKTGTNADQAAPGIARHYNTNIAIPGYI
jgi:hypothetical protein